MMDAPAIVPLAPAGLDAALPALVELLRACVAGGASIGWPHPPTPESAAAFWRRCAASVAAGERRLWVALERADEPASVVGSAQLLLEMPPNGRHRADVAKVMVHPRARRRGLAAALMARTEAEAQAEGRSLLVLDTLAGCDAERLYERLGFQRCGRIPAYAQLGDGTLEATTVMFKRLHPGGLQLRVEAHDGADARALQAERSTLLQRRFGRGDEAGCADLDPAPGVFVIARDAGGHPLGCGALRPLPPFGARSGELDHLHVRRPRCGIGRALLAFLEHEAALLGWRELALSAHREHVEALAFFRAQGYTAAPPCGRPTGGDGSVCLAKAIG